MNGSIRQRGKGTWEIAIDLGKDGAGKRRRKFVNVKGSKGVAQRTRRELLTALDKGMSLDTSKSTVKQFLDRWLSDYAETNTSPRTVVGYREKIRNYIVPALGMIALYKLAPQDVQALYSEMLAFSANRLVDTSGVT